jgi:N-methylhydantoinase A
MRGYDPRDFALIAFGGAGPLHGVALATELSIPTVIVPPHPGVTSAMGCLLVDIQHDLLTTYLVDTAKADPQAIEAEFRLLETEARTRLTKEGVADKDIILKRTIDMRYSGQWRSLAVPVGTPFTSVQETVDAFGAAHEREYNYRRAGAGIEIFRLNLTAVGLTPKAELARHVAVTTRPEPRAWRRVGFDDNSLETPIYWRDDLSSGTELPGPAVIQQLDSTTLVPPGATVTVDPWLNLAITV